MSLKDFEPCSHIGCLNHVTHPCEGCGRIHGMKTKTIADIENEVREINLSERLEMCAEMIGNMCKERRPPKMSIPVNAKDEDIFISTTLKDALESIDSQESIEP